MSARTSRSVDRTMEKMLRKMSRPTRQQGGMDGSTATAAKALSQMAEIQRRMSLGDIAAAEFLVERSTQGVAAGAETQPADAASAVPQHSRPAPRKKAASGVIAAVGAASVVAVLLGVAGVWGLSGGGSHSVAGFVTLDKKPLAGVEVCFSPKAGGAAPVRVKTSDLGQFRIERIPAGEYRIFLVPDDGHAGLPPKYRSADSTPFGVRLTRDLTNLRMLANSESKKPAR